MAQFDSDPRPLRTPGVFRSWRQASRFAATVLAGWVVAVLLSLGLGWWMGAWR